MVNFDTHHYTTELDPFFMLPAKGVRPCAPIQTTNLVSLYHSIVWRWPRLDGAHLLPLVRGGTNDLG